MNFLFCLQVSGWNTDLLQIYTEQTYWVPWGSLWTSPKDLHEWIVSLYIRSKVITIITVSFQNTERISQPLAISLHVPLTKSWPNSTNLPWKHFQSVPASDPAALTWIGTWYETKHHSTDPVIHTYLSDRKELYFFNSLKDKEIT